MQTMANSYNFCILFVVKRMGAEYMREVMKEKYRGTNSFIN